MEGGRLGGREEMGFVRSCLVPVVELSRGKRGR